MNTYTQIIFPYFYEFNIQQFIHDSLTFNSSYLIALEIYPVHDRLSLAVFGTGWSDAMFALA